MLTFEFRMKIASVVSIAFLSLMLRRWSKHVIVFGQMFCIERDLKSLEVINWMLSSKISLCLAYIGHSVSMWLTSHWHSQVIHSGSMFVMYRALWAWRFVWSRRRRMICFWRLGAIDVRFLIIDIPGADTLDLYSVEVRWSDHLLVHFSEVIEHAWRCIYR